MSAKSLSDRITVRLLPEDRRRLEAMAQRRGGRASTVLREALLRFLEGALLVVPKRRGERGR